MKTGSERCFEYAQDVVDGVIDAPKLVRLAAERFFADLDRDDVEFRPGLADQAVANIEGLRHVKGDLQGQNITLQPFQCFWIANLFGWYFVESGIRRFREAYVQIPRKNGKTLTVIGIALNMLAADGEGGAEVYLGATSQDQARKLLFSPAKRIVETCPEFQEHFGILIQANTLSIAETFSTLTTVIRKPDDGTNPHCAIVDEYHLHDTDDQWATFNSGMGARRQPLLHVVTTAGKDLASPCKVYRDLCVRYLEGTMGGQDPDLVAPGDNVFVLVYEPDPEDADRWHEPELLAKVNPNMGVSVSAEYLLDQQRKATVSASQQNEFKTKNLNMWVGAKVAWMNTLAWQRQARPKLKLEGFANQPAFLGLDLASKLDVAALGYIFPEGDKFTAFVDLFVPEGAVEENERYRRFVDEGLMTMTPGNMTDYATIEERVRWACTTFDVRGVGFDEWQANYMAQRLDPEGDGSSGVPMEQFPHTRKYMSDPMKEIEATVIDRRFWHDGNAALTWMVGNTMNRISVGESHYPTKSNPNDPFCKIDGVVALIMAMGLATRERESGSLDDWLMDIE